MFKNLFLFFILVSCTVARLPEFDNNRGKIFGLLTRQLRTIFQPGSTWWRKFVNAKKIEKCGNYMTWNQNLRNDSMMHYQRNKKKVSLELFLRNLCRCIIVRLIAFRVKRTVNSFWKSILIFWLKNIPNFQSISKC